LLRERAAVDETVDLRGFEDLFRGGNDGGSEHGGERGGGTAKFEEAALRRHLADLIEHDEVGCRGANDNDRREEGGDVVQCPPGIRAHPEA
jgi:hypothetical protein